MAQSIQALSLSQLNRSWICFSTCESCRIDTDRVLLQQIQELGSVARITFDGEVVKDPNTILRNGSELVYHQVPWREPNAPYLIEVLYEDDHMIALNKPGGLQVLSGGFFHQRTVLTQLLWREKQKVSHTACREPHPVPVHRLGRGTSGILLCAKTKHAKTQLAAYFADGTSHNEDGSNTKTKLHTTRKISKIYQALLTGIISEDKVIVTLPIGTVRYPGVAKGLYVASPTGKPALTKVEVLERDKNHTFVQVIKITAPVPSVLRTRQEAGEKLSQQSYHQYQV